MKHSRESIWSMEVEIPRRKPLDANLSVEVAVIGYGMAGALTAYLLKEHGFKPIVFEASTIGSGQTKNTTAKITSQHGLIYHRLSTHMGLLYGEQYAVSNEEAIYLYEKLIKAEGIKCDFQRLPAYLYSNTALEDFEVEAMAASRYGIKASVQNGTELPLESRFALKFENQAMFHPLKFLRCITDALTIYENSRVTNVSGNILTVQTDAEDHKKEYEVKAEHIVFATHYPFINVPGYFFLRMHQERSYAIALKNAAKLNGCYLGIDEDGYSLRNAGDLLIFGGGSHRTGENTEGGKYDELRTAAARIFPEAKEVACWSAQDCVSIDDVPYIGVYSEDAPDWYVATGFKKWGMSSSMVAAKLITDLIEGKESPFIDLYSPQRFDLSASVKSMVTDGLKVAEGLGESIAADKERRCPHLGCKLEFNPDEDSWDCPCHGSRFSEDGTLIDNPAQINLYDERGIYK